MEYHMSSVRIISFIVLLTVAVNAADAKQPNVVLFIADDMGYSDLGCYGGEIETPNLDSLAGQGIRFTNFYVNNMCWPTRASLMTGLYPKTALPKNGSATGGLHPESTTLPEALGDAGYATYMSGKWHLSGPAQPDGPGAPHRRGFDHFYGTIYGASDFFAPVDLQLDGKSMVSEWESNPDYYYTDAKTDYALKFLKQHDESDSDRPFFLYVAYTCAHWPLHARPADIEHYKGRYAMGWDKLRLQRHSRMKKLGVVDPSWELSPRHDNVPAWEDEEHKEWQQRRMEVYAAQITCMDRNIGRVVDYLKSTGRFDDTMILYQHDNGGCHVEYSTTRGGSWSRDYTTDGRKQPIQSGNIPGLMPGPQTTFQSYGYGWANASNTPFRLFKQHDHEGGTRSPLIVSWPAAVASDLAGGVTGEVCHAIDIMPTLLDAAGAGPVQQQPFGFEGRSFLPAVLGKSEECDPRGDVFWSHAKGRAIRSGDWKLVADGRGPWELYNVAIDGTELNDLANEMPEKVSELKERFNQWSARTNLGQKKPAVSKAK